MKITTEILKKISRDATPNVANMQSVVTAVNDFGARYGIDKPHRLAHFLSQLAHESGGFNYDKEIASGAAYEGRKDLGNTQKGDGRKFKGRGPIQITGRANYAAFTKWAKKLDPNAPDFTRTPEAVNTDPWEGLAPIWYWEEGNPDPQNRSLNWYADKNNIEMVTRRINGGINGLSDRMHYYDRSALVLLGYRPDAIRSFQSDAAARGDYPKKDIDGDSGPQTRTALHVELMRRSGAQKEKDTAIAPVTEKKEVVPVAVEKEVKKRTGWLWQGIAGLFGTGTVGTWLADAEPQTVAIVAGDGVVIVVLVLATGVFIVRRVKAIKAELDA